MKKECPNPNCNYQNNTSCDEGEKDVSKCSFYKTVFDKEIKKEVDSEKNKLLLSWTSNAMGLLDIPLIAQRSNTKIVGIIGASDAGKTSFLGTFYNLLHNGYQLDDYRFSGSYTLKGWEYVSQPMKFNNPNEAHFPKHTTSDPKRFQGLLHVALKKGNHLKDVLFTDASGEWFVEWADKPNADLSQGAKWIHAHADSFLLFIDCEKLIGTDRGMVKETITNIAHRLNQNLKDRPVGIVWAKADKLTEVREKFRDKLRTELHEIFPNSKEFEISTIPKSIPDELVHTNIMKMVNWVLNEQDISRSKKVEIKLEEADDDYFLSLRRLYG